MKKILSITFLALLCNVAFSQADTTAIFQKADSLNTLGDTLFIANKYTEALDLYKQAAEMTKDIENGNNIHYATALLKNGLIYNELGNHNEALNCFIQSKDIRKRLLGENHLYYATILSDIASVYSKMGNYQNALKYYLQVKEIRKNIIGEEDPLYASTLNNIGLMYSYIEDYQNALKYHLETLQIREKIFDEEHPGHIMSLGNIGIIYYYMHDYHNALKYDLRAMEILEKYYGEEHPFYDIFLNNVSVIYSETGDLQNALKYQQKAIEIQKKINGEDNPDYAMLLYNIGNTYHDMGDYQNALKYQQQSLAIKEKTIGPEHPNCAYNHNSIGLLYKDMGDYQNALKYIEQGLNIIKNTLGEKQSKYALLQHNKGLVYYDMGDYQNCIIENKNATEILKDNMIRNFSFMTSHEREAYWNANNEYFSYNIKYMHHLPTDTLATKTSYDTELITKGLLLASEISITNTIMESGDTALISEYETLKKVHLQLNDELEKPIAERVYNCDSLENEIQKMERHIMEKSKEFGDVTHFIKIDWKEVQNSLKQNDVAIEFANFTENDTTRYLALVLTKNMEAPVCIPLFTKNDIGKMLRGIAPAKLESPTDDENRGATTVAAKRLGIYESTNLYNALWKPLEKYFPENPRIYFAPSGDLHQIAVEYAPTGNGKTISDKYEIYRVSSTRFLAMNYMPKPFKNSVLYGGIYYDSDTITMKHESDRYSTRSATSYTSFADFNRNEDRGSLNYLPGTKTEVEDIVGKLKKKRIKSQLYEGSAANEESFKALSGEDISVLHIATHGFFLPTDEKMSGDQSLIQSGLLLSGANYAWQNKPLPDGIEDGILTAKEISFMDLRKTDLVVLSACQTALGEITGEGVFGLQRGFKKAGARTIIMSLWPVDDNATLLMMTEFYANLTKGMTKREAFLAAQNKVKTTAGFENPRYWAAFIMLDGNEK